MDRHVQPNDLAIITVDNVEYPFVITSITPQRILTEDYIIIPTTEGWQIQGYDLPHAIRFQATQVRDRLLSGVEDVDRLILLDLDYRSLLAACSSDPYTNRICQDDFFWQQKVLKDMGLEVMKNKLPKMSYREQYRTLIEGMYESYAIKKGRLDYLILMKVVPDSYLIDTAAGYGHINILKWGEKHGVILNGTTANNAASRGKINVLNWLYEKGIYPDDRGIIRVPFAYKKDVIEWLLNHPDVPIDMKTLVSNLVIDNNIAALDLLETYGILPDQQDANVAMAFSDYRILEWFTERGYYPTD